MRPRHRATLAVLAVGAALLLGTASATKTNNGHGHQPPATTTSVTTAPSTSSSAATTIVSPASTDAFAASLGYPTRNVTISDEFTGTGKPDTTRWGAKTYSAGSAAVWDGVNECNLDGQGNLDIAATKRSDGLWASCFLSGLHPYSGPRFVDVRAKVPAGNGTWAAPAWEWSAPWGSAPGPELDVVEQLGREPQTYHATLHYWDANGADHSISLPIAAGVNLADGFHDYGMAVRADRVDFFLDFRPVASISQARWPSVWLFDAAQVVLNVDLDMGGSWAGTVDPALPSPQHELVDYVRVYQP